MIEMENTTYPTYKITLTKDVVVEDGDKKLPVKEVSYYHCIVIPNERIVITGSENCIIPWDILTLIKRLIDEGILNLK